MQLKNILCLGDSYTIGEQVAIYDSFAYQLVKNLRKGNIHLNAPEIIAKTGFTTDELLLQIKKTKLLKAYDYCTILIGVNNQYRNFEIKNFEKDLEKIIKIAFQKTKSKKNIILLSIPDWGKTPFAKESDITKIETEINNYNNIILTMSVKYNLKYIDITTSQRKRSVDNKFLASDLLHPSAKEYHYWAKKCFSYFKK